MPQVANIKKKIVDNPFTWLALITSVIILICLVILVDFRKENDLTKVLAVVGGKDITRYDLNASIYSLGFLGSVEEPQETSQEVEKQLLNILVEREILERKAEEIGINISEESILNKAKEINSDYDTYSEIQKNYLQDNARYALLRDEVERAVVGWSEGYYVLARFDQHFYGNPSKKSEADRKSLIEKDKTYAKVLIDSIYNDLVNNKMTIEEAIEKTNNDERIGKSSWYGWTMSASSSYSKEEAVLRGKNQRFSSFWEEIANAPVKKYSEVISLDMEVDELSAIGAAGEKVVGAYTIVYKNNGNRGEAASFELWLEREKQELGVDTYL